MSHITLRELHERRLSSMSRDQREAFEAAYRRAALVAEAELVDLGGSPTTDDRDHS